MKDFKSYQDMQTRRLAEPKKRMWYISHFLKPVLKLKLNASPLLLGDGLNDFNSWATLSEIDDNELRRKSTELRSSLYHPYSLTIVVSLLMKLIGVDSTSDGVWDLEHSIDRARL